MAIDYIAFRGETNIGYIIAPPNATDEDKKKADLVLDDVNGSPHTQLTDTVDMLHDRRGGNADVAIVIEFCPGVIELPNETNWYIPANRSNIYLYGNGVKTQGSYESSSNGLLDIMGKCYLYDMIVENNSYGMGISANNSTLSNCSGSSDYGNGISATNSTLSNCSGSSDYGNGISATNSTLSNCTGSSEYYTGIYVYGSCIIQGCDCAVGGISVPAGFVGTYPNTLALLQAFNKGSITERN